MAYAQYIPADVADAISKVCSFCQGTMGWTVVGPEITIPGRDATFTLSSDQYSYTTSSYGHVDYEVLQVTVGSILEPFTASTTWLTPITKLYVYAGETPAPWVHLVFETAPGFFAHMHFGYLDALGEASGNAVADGTMWPVNNNLGSSHWDWSYERNHMLLSGNTYGSDVTHSSGAVQVEHADAPFPTYYFGQSTRDPEPGHWAGGGFGDAFTGCLSALGASAVDGLTTLHPLTIFAALAGGYDTYVTPVGTVCGIRCVDARQFEPGELITVANKNWRVFPMGTTRYASGELNPIEVQPGNVTKGTNSSYWYATRMGTEWVGVACLEE